MSTDCQVPLCPLNPQVTEFRITSLEQAVTKIADAVSEIAANTTQIAKLEIRHTETRDGLDRAFQEIRNLQAEDKVTDSRLKVIEIEMPGLKETRGWVTRAMLGIVAFVGVAILGLVVLK
jgi:hypothetical protein